MFKRSHLFQTIVLGIHVSFQECILNHLLWRVQGFDFFCGLMPRFHMIHLPLELGMIWWYLMIFVLPLPRTFYESHCQLLLKTCWNQSSVCFFFITGHLWGPNQQKPVRCGKFFRLKGWHTCGGANGCHQLWRTWNQRYGKLKDFWENLVRISTKYHLILEILQYVWVYGPLWWIWGCHFLCCGLCILICSYSMLFPYPPTKKYIVHRLQSQKYTHLPTWVIYMHLLEV